MVSERVDPGGLLAVDAFIAAVFAAPVHVISQQDGEHLGWPAFSAAASAALKAAA